MSTPPVFEEDVFISYAHIDDQPLAEGLKGWVETFHERLKVRLEQIAGQRVRVWRDRKLNGNDEFGEVIITKLSHSAALVAVISPRYVKSDWCVREFEEFCARAGASVGLKLKGKLRVFKVVKSYVPLDSPEPLHGPRKVLAECLGSSLGYQFFEYDVERDRSREFSPDVTPARDIRYWERLDDLAYDIKQMLDVLARGNTPSPPPTGKTIFLSETTSDIASERDVIKRELQQKGHVVLPDQQLPLNSPKLRDALRDYISRSSLSIHLLGGNYGITPELEERSLTEIQAEVADERGESLRRIVWMPAGLEPSEERQRLLVNHYQRGLNGHRGVEVLQTSLEELKKHIEERLAPPRKPEPELTGEGRPPGIYLICDREDMEEVTPLADYLFERGLNVFLPAVEGDESMLREDHKANLIDC